MADVTVTVGQGGYWGDDSWGQNPWGESIPIAAAVSAVGSVNVVVSYAVTGLEATTSVGSVSVEADAIVSPTGLGATTSVGSVSVVEGSGVVTPFAALMFLSQA